MAEKVLSGPSKLLSALQSYCSHLSAVLLSYDGRSTLTWLNRRKKIDQGGAKKHYFHIIHFCNLDFLALAFHFSSFSLFSTRPDFFLRSSRNRVVYLLYKSKTTDKREQYVWRAEILISPSRPDSFQPSSCIWVNLLSYVSKTTDRREQYNWMAEK